MTETTMNPLYEPGGLATEAGVVAELAAKAAKVDVHTIEVKDDRGRLAEIHVFGRGGHGELERIDTIDVASLQRHAAGQHPDRLAGMVTAHTPETMVAYARRHLSTDLSTLWGDVDAAKITVVLNDHGPDGEFFPGWGDHQVTLRLDESPELKAWKAHNEKNLTQEQFGDFLEERLIDIVEPDGSTMLDVARTMTATIGASFRRAVNAHDGTVQLSWQEDVDAKAGGSGQLEVPSQFEIRVKPFVGTDPVTIIGKFRYRVAQGGDLVLGYRLLNLDEVRRAAVEQVLTEVASDLDLTAFEGVAPAPRR